MAAVSCRGRSTAVRVSILLSALLGFTSPAYAQSELVLYAGDATTAGAWQRVSDATAAGGVRLWNPDRGVAKVSTPAATPADHFDLVFHADAGRAYRLWIRGRAENDGWTNDSVFVQFSGSVSATGAPTFRIGTSQATTVSIEEGSGRGLSGWGWGDNGYDGFGPLIYFAASGPQTLRVQRREDGISIDQVVLSSAAYLTIAPGLTKNDTTILGRATGAPAAAPAVEIAFGTANPSRIEGAWLILDDPTAAGGKAVGTLDRGAAKVAAAAVSPASYVEYTFHAEANRPYRLWMRGRAEADYWGNDSIFVQFSGSLTVGGQPSARIGTTSAFVVNLEDGANAGLAGWGWQDNGYGIGVLGPLVMFAQTGEQTIRLQNREDGLRIDQIVLSSERYLTTAPGALKNDTTVICGGVTGPVTSPPPAPQPPPAPEIPSGPVRLRVLEWNLHHGVGTDGVYDLDRIATWMAAMKPDIIMLNEVERFTGWGNEDQPERYRSMLETRTGRRWYSHFSQEFGAWTSTGKGHQILSVFPFQSTAHAITTPSDGLKGAGAVSQATIIVNGRTINLFVAHLDPYDQAMRLTQARDVMRFASGFAENRILAGDMNAWPDQSSIAEFTAAYADAWTVAAAKGAAVGVTGISPWGATKKGRIDYVFISRGASDLAVIDVTVVDTRDASGHMPSDHRPVLATIEVR